MGSELSIARRCLTREERLPYCTRVLKRTLTPALVAASVMVLCGCSGEENLSINLFLVQAPTGSPPSCAASASTTKLATGTYLVRLTFMRRPSATTAISPTKLRQQYAITCDRVLTAGQALDFRLPVEVSSRYSLRVEAFEPAKGSTPPRLAYSGQMEDVDVASDEIKIYLRPTDQLTCANALSLPRAFHTATLLPNGQVLILGGMVAESTGKSEKLHADDTETAYATASAELYDPASMTFSDVDGSLATARAFHQAVLLPSPEKGPFEVLVIGGVSPTTTGGAAFQLKAGSPASIGYPFLITPSDKAQAAEALLVTVEPAKDGVGKAKLTSKALASLPTMMFPQAVVTPDGNDLVVAGGGATYTGTGTSKGFTQDLVAFWLELKDKTARKGQDPQVDQKYQIKLNRTRVGHAAAPLGSDVLLLGGTMDGPPPCGSSAPPGCDSDWEKNNIAESLSVSTGTAAAKLAVFTGETPEPSGWHTLTPIGLADGQTSPSTLLLAGGFVLGRDTNALRSVNEQTKKTSPLMLIQDGASPKAKTVTATSGDFIPAGYHDAIALADGSVLLTGGNVNSNFIKTAPCNTYTSPFCAYNQLVIYTLSGETAVPRSQTTLAKAMNQARFGHRMVRLMDNTVLITGGVTIKLETVSSQIVPVPILSAFSEVLNPRTGLASEDPFGRKGAEDYNTAKGESGFQCLPQEE